MIWIPEAMTCARVHKMMETPASIATQTAFSDILERDMERIVQEFVDAHAENTEDDDASWLEKGCIKLSQLGATYISLIRIAFASYRCRRARGGTKS